MLCLAATPARAAEPTYVFLIQNSDWMEPFFNDDRTTKFDRRVAGFIDRVAPPGAPIVIATFNKSGDVPGATSPTIAYQGLASREAVAQTIAQLQLAHRPGSGGGAVNSDYKEALINTLRDVLQGRQAVIFMVTNNKSAPVVGEAIDDPAVKARTEAFDHLLRDNGYIPRVVAWPLPLKVFGRHPANGLVIYGIAYGDDSSLPLKRASEAVELQSFLGDPPVRLKPLALDPLSLQLTPGRLGKASWYQNAHGAVLVDGISAGDDPIRLIGKLTNTHYPYVIERARMIVSWTPDGGKPITVATGIAPASVSGLAPFASIDNVAIDLAVFAADREHLFDDTRDFPGTLSIKLTDLKFGLAPDYTRKMVALFGNGAAPAPDVPDALPRETPVIFLNYTGVDHGVTEVPLTLGVKFFPWPLILISGGSLLLLILLALLFLLGFKETPFGVMIDGEAKTVGLRPFQSKDVQGLRGTYRVSRGLGSPTVKIKPS